MSLASRLDRVEREANARSSADEDIYLALAAMNLSQDMQDLMRECVRLVQAGDGAALPFPWAHLTETFIDRARHAR